MYRLLAVFALVSCAVAGTIPDDLDGRIVNGVDTTIQAHPYQVSLQTILGKHICGGSIISEDIVVTAAHCLEDYRFYEFKVRLGSTEYKKGGELVAVKVFKNHENYNNITKVNDVAVIKLATPVVQSTTVRYINLSEKTPASGTTAVATGWGVTCFLFCKESSVILQEVKVNIIDQEQCASSEFKYGGSIRKGMFCAQAEKKDTCQGDSGGPLVAENQLIGIVSWGVGCGIKELPGVYCDIATVRSWIEKTANEL